MHEQVVLLDEQFRPIGTMPKSDVHSAQTPLHRAFSLFLFRPAGDILLQQRSAEKVAFPLVWSNSCCGHPLPGEGYEEAACRRAQVELGITGITPKIVIPDYSYRAEMHGIVENEFCPVLTGVTNSEPQPNPDEVAAVRWMPWEEWVQETLNHPERYSPWCVEETRLLYTRVPSNSLFLGA